MHICDHCNLNCKGCGHFSPIAEKKFVDLNVFERDFNRLSELAGRQCEKIDLMGGEPLLHPEITTIFNIARKYFDGLIFLVTNGILLPNKPEEFWECCKKNDISISISHYPIQINRVQIEAQAYKHGIILAPRENREKEWQKHKRDISGSQNIEEAYRKCIYGNTCLFLEDGKLCQCGFPLLVKHFNKYFNKNDCKYDEPTENDFVDIFKVNSLDEILEKFRHPIPYCRYCTNYFIHPDWEISKKQIDEWT
jgi:organic radical activating enzyme